MKYRILFILLGLYVCAEYVYRHMYLICIFFKNKPNTEQKG